MSLPKAVNLPIDQLLELSLFQNVRQLRVFQAKLTRTSNVLSQVVNIEQGLGKLLPPVELDLLQRSIELLQKVNLGVEAAKARKLDESRSVQEQDLTATHFPFLNDSLDQQIGGLCITICLNQLVLLRPEKSPEEFKSELLVDARAARKNGGVENFTFNLFAECQGVIREYLNSYPHESVKANLEELKFLVTSCVLKICDSEREFLSNLVQAIEPSPSASSSTGRAH
ncbi:hypothetical protein K5D56_04675 [Pseudomonas cichorii]|uniref:Uncharacterized protein n=1 Tax=Pseudomonas serbiensis TaxID=3064350 RepID=A0ABT9CXG1_9PSED|nr:MULTISPECIES: hypothetical protein [Pseudomonas]MBI6854656.1 hypothetical protein [Pseudomonas cichorii]MBX8588668.1 hypothetical protein [Pseudomonas cichorii]MDO7930189.1 hypothetical protein [Pseudomonas sp. KFB-138]